MKYVYPKLSEYDLSFVRLGGAGLGNLLFIYSRALIYAKNNDCKMIFPTWRSIKIGPYIRHEKDKRFYGDLFKNNSGYISGLKKFNMRLFGHKVHESNKDSAKDGDIINFDVFKMDFDGILNYRDIIREDILKNLANKNKKAEEYNFSDCINIHIRLGDFVAASAEALKNGANNTSIPISWYVDVLGEIRNILGRDIKAYIFSDGTDEQLSDILKLPNVERITFGTSIADIVALSRAKLMIASGSSFSLWARFLNGCSAIAYTNQLKSKNLCTEENFEIETLGEFSQEESLKIKKLFEN